MKSVCLKSRVLGGINVVLLRQVSVLSLLTHGGLRLFLVFLKTLDFFYIYAVVYVCNFFSIHTLGMSRLLCSNRTQTDAPTFFRCKKHA